MNYIVELVEDIFFQTSQWKKSLMLINGGQPWIEMFMNFVELVICANN
jgi:hypothetical protein